LFAFIPKIHSTNKYRFDHSNKTFFKQIIFFIVLTTLSSNKCHFSSFEQLFLRTNAILSLFEQLFLRTNAICLQSNNSFFEQMSFILIRTTLSRCPKGGTAAIGILTKSSKSVTKMEIDICFQSFAKKDFSLLCTNTRSLG
jgi:hypothetical protein